MYYYYYLNIQYICDIKKNIEAEKHTAVQCKGKKNQEAYERFQAICQTARYQAPRRNFYHFGRQKNNPAFWLVPRLYTDLYLYCYSRYSTPPPIGCWKIYRASYDVVIYRFMGFRSRIPLWYSPTLNSWRNWWPLRMGKSWLLADTVSVDSPFFLFYSL